MAGVKALKTIAQRLDDTKNLARAADDLVPVTRLEATGGRSTLNAILDFDEYDRVAGQLEATQEAVTPQAVRQEIARQQEIQFEERRRQVISQPDADLELSFQTRNIEEFSDRLFNQLQNPRYMTRAIMRGQDSAARESQIKRSLARHTKTKNRVLASLRRDARWEQRVTDWFGDSPYKDEVHFHVDKITDPTRSNSFIQFEEPRELGLHAGTNAAAESVIKADVESVMAAQDDLTKEFAQLAEASELPEAEFNSLVVDAVENRLIAKFRKGKGLFDAELWEEAMQAVQDALDTIRGRPELPVKVRESLGRLQEFPTPNTTPMLFRGKNGLLLEDTGRFFPDNVSFQLRQIFPADADAIDAAMGAGSPVEKNKALQKFIESKGFDHVVYVNAVEDRGTLSIINWNPDLQASPWDAAFTRDNPVKQGQTAAAYIIGALGIGGGNAAVQSQEQGT